METTTGEGKNYTIDYMEMGAQQGWQCPVCKRILAPFITECPCKGEGRKTFTYATLNEKGE